MVAERIDEGVEEDKGDGGFDPLARFNPFVNPVVNPFVRLSMLAMENLCRKSRQIVSRFCERRRRRKTTESVILEATILAGFAVVVVVVDVVVIVFAVVVVFRLSKADRFFSNAATDPDDLAVNTVVFAVISGEAAESRHTDSAPSSSLSTVDSKVVMIQVDSKIPS